MGKFLKLKTKENAISANKNDFFDSSNLKQLLSPSNKNQTVSEAKVLPLKQLRDTITDIFQQKQVYDAKCKELQMPIETMEQYLYTYLTKKYGLKSLIVQWAATIINGVKIYLKSDADVALFAKCLKNECDQEFRSVQDFVKLQIQSAIKMVLKERNPIKGEGEIQQAVDAIINCQHKMQKWLWRKTILKLYSQEERDRITQKVEELVQSQKLQEGHGQCGTLSDEGGEQDSFSFTQMKKVLSPSIKNAVRHKRSTSGLKHGRTRSGVLNSTMSDLNKTMILSPSKSENKLGLLFTDFQNVNLHHLS